MHKINREALTCLTSLLSAKLHLKAGTHATDPNISVVIEAVSAGWFQIPAGREGAYTKRQFERFGERFAAAPWVKDTQAKAATFDQVLRKQLGHRYDRVFAGGKKLTSPRTQANALPYSIARMPLWFEAGAFTSELLVSSLEDTQVICRRIQAEMRALEPAWVLAESVDPAALHEHLRLTECLHLLLPIMAATHPTYLPTEHRNWLWQVQTGVLSIREYIARVERQEQQHADQVRAAWLARFARIQTLASTLDGLSSYHQATITRRIKTASMGFKVVRKGVSVVIDLGDLHEVGARHSLADGFELVNFVLALDQELAGTQPNWHHYHAAECRANAKIERMRAEIEQESPARHLRDDFAA